MQKNETIHERIALLVKTFGHNKKTVFACLIDSNEASIRGYMKSVVPRQDILERIARKFDICTDWLLTGRGEMLKSGTSQSVEPWQSTFAPTEIIELATRLGEQINENKHLQQENIQLKTEIEQLKNK